MPSLFLNKVVDFRLATFLKKRLWHRCFSVNLAKFLRTPFFTEHLRWLLLYGVSSGPYFSVFSPNTGKYGPEKTPYLDTFHEVQIAIDVNKRYKENI